MMISKQSANMTEKEVFAEKLKVFVADLKDHIIFV